VKKNTLLYFIIILLAILAIALSIYIWRSNRFSWDLSLIVRLQTIDNNYLRWFLEWVSYLSTGWRSAIFVITCVLLLAWRTGILEGFLLALAGIIVPFNYLIKVAVSQPRPESPLIRVFISETDNGYPSGHAFFAILVLGMLGFIMFTTLRKTIWRVVSLAAIILIILLIGISRIYLGVHWPSDVLGGYLIGGFFLSCLILLYVRMKSLF
jgi:undecaprenyl-diphosphatase